ncbi:peptidase family C78-domain-containing protein [Tuber indicum]|nr:peptidase family C78-domain-containing protein [Tuber indicum]
MAGAVEVYECPWCRFKSGAEYTILMHIEAIHTPDSPFMIKDEHGNRYISSEDLVDTDFDIPPEDDAETTYILCTEDGCEENVLLMDLQTHLDFHAAEQISMEDVRSQTPVSGDDSGSYSGSQDMVLSEQGKSRYGYGRSEGSIEGGRRERRENKTLIASRERDKNGYKLSFAQDQGSSSSLVPSKTPSHLKSPKRSHKLVFGLPVKDPWRQREKEKEKERERERELERERDRERAREVRRPVERSVVRPIDGQNLPGQQQTVSSNHILTPVKRLGKSDLGPYAHEAQMPAWLRKELEQGGKLTKETRLDHAAGRLVRVVTVSNETPDLIPVIALLCEHDPRVVRAWVCHPGTKHVGKQIRGEGGFCGYRNIQMVVSYIQNAYPRGSHPFEGRIPTILRLQDWIEEGWDKGINPSARLETGGIKGTRKYIGTSEAQTMFVNLNIPCRPHSFTRSEGLKTQEKLLDWVENYFSDGGILPEAAQVKVYQTQKPPIYFQHSGHSMTIVGCETNRDGSKNLLVFDPFFTPSAPMKNLIGARSLSHRMDPELLLRAYRRRMNYLQKYKEFEVITLDS